MYNKQNNSNMVRKLEAVSEARRNIATRYDNDSDNPTADKTINE